MCELTDNMENKLTKHNTENSNNIQHELVNLFSMLSVSLPMVLSSGVRVVHYLSFLSTRTPLLKTIGELTDNMENKLTKHNTENSKNVQHEPHCLNPCVN
jgi:hypothetical protein